MTTSTDRPSIDEILRTAPEVLEGFPAFAPQLARECGDYPPEVFPLLSAVEEKSFWFQARNRILLRLFERFVGRSGRILEVGCGTGFVLSGLATRFPDYDLTGAEAFVEGLKFAQGRVPSARFLQMDATEMPFRDDFDAIGFFDVLEHIPDDEKALVSAHEALRPDGVLIVTVPQHDWLWSSYDDASDHKRRYSRKELVEKVRSAGFRVRSVTSFVSCLLPAMLLSRLRRRGPVTSENLMDQMIKDLSPGRLVNGVAAGLMRIDETLIRLGFSLPAGGSLAMVASKIESPIA